MKCILELNKRRGDSQALSLQQRLQQPALKVWRQGYEGETSYARRLVIENTGEELTELQVTKAPFLVISGMCVIDLAEKSDKKKCGDLSVAYVPLANYYSSGTWGGAYMAVAGFRCNSSLYLEGWSRAQQGQANPLSLESSDSDGLCSPQYFYPRNWFAELGGFCETRGE